jgi:hypothetical protein
MDAKTTLKKTALSNVRYVFPLHVRANRHLRFFIGWFNKTLVNGIAMPNHKHRQLPSR